jgi:hypothetical protein
MELKFEHDNALTVKCISAVASAIGITKVSIALENSQLAITNALVLLAIIFVLFWPTLHTQEKGMSSTLDVTKLLHDALNTQPTIIGQPNDDYLLALKEKLLDVLHTITYDRADGIHHFVGVIQSNTAYKANHNGDAFPIPQRLGLWDDKIDKNLTVVELKNPKPCTRLVLKTWSLEGSQRRLQETHPCCG